MKGLIDPILIALMFFAAAQERASMSSPVLRRAEGELIITTHFSAFIPGEAYRIGFGVTRGKLRGAKLEVSKNDTPLKNEVVEFVQDYTAVWWNVDQIMVEGFLLAPQDLPKEGAPITLRLTMPRAEADKLERIYVFVARRYGPKLWYIEDGTDIAKSDW